MYEDDLDPQGVAEFFAGLEGFMKAVGGASACPDMDCAVHYRNDLHKSDEHGSVRITYVGDKAAYSYAVVDWSGIVTRTEFYVVGEGAIGEGLRPSLSTEKPTADVNKIHEYYVRLLRDGKNI